MRIQGAGSPPGSGWSLKALKPAEVEALHEATLQVLWRGGIRIEDQEAAEVFAAAGATVERRDDHTQCVAVCGPGAIEYVYADENNGRRRRRHGLKVFGWK